MNHAFSDDDYNFEDTPVLMTLCSLADELGIDHTTIRSWERRGFIKPSFRTAHDTTLYTRESFFDAINGNHPFAARARRTIAKAEKRRSF
ncbi:MAG: MerR family transcriptional regulator [Myxococcota bacterium]